MGGEEVLLVLSPMESGYMMGAGPGASGVWLLPFPALVPLSPLPVPEADSFTPSHHHIHDSSLCVTFMLARCTLPWCPASWTGSSGMRWDAPLLRAAPPCLTVSAGNC